MLSASRMANLTKSYNKKETRLKSKIRSSKSLTLDEKRLRSSSLVDNMDDILSNDKVRKFREIRRKTDQFPK